MRNALDKNYYREKQNTHFMFNEFIPKMCHLGDNVENMAEQEKPQMPI